MVSNTYKYATWILVIIVLLLGWMLYKSDNPNLKDALQKAGEAGEECRNDIRAWMSVHPAGSSLTAEDAAQLQGILGDCESGFSG